jgi:hypothetical protein
MARPALWIFAAVVLLRVVALAQLADSAAFLPTGGDMQFYDDWAQRIARGEWTDGRAFYAQPFYPYLLAFFYSLIGRNPFLPLLLQVCFDAATAVVLFKLALRVFPAVRQCRSAPPRRSASLRLPAGRCSSRRRSIQWC